MGSGSGVKKKGAASAISAGPEINSVIAPLPNSTSAGQGVDSSVVNGVHDNKKAPPPSSSSSSTITGKSGVGKLKPSVHTTNGVGSPNKKDSGGDAKVNGITNGALGDGDHVMMSPDSL